MLGSVRLLVVGFLLLGVFSWSGESVAADSDQPSPLILSIDVEGNHNVEKEAVLVKMKTRAGQRLERRQLSRDVRTLYKTGFFSDIRFVGTRTAQGIHLVCHVKEYPLIAKLTMEGNDQFPTKDLQLKMKLKPGRIYSPRYQESDRNTLRKGYLKDGYYQVGIDFIPTRRKDGRIDLLIRVHEGEVTRINRIHMIGNKAFSDAVLRKEIASRRSDLLSWFSDRDIFDTKRFSADGQLLQQYYLNHGYLDMKLDSEQITMAADKKSFSLTFSIHEGVSYNVEKVVLQGDLVPDQKTLQELIKLKPGDIYSLNDMRATIEAITERVGDEGYAFATVTPLLQRNIDNHTVAITFDIEKGEEVYVERIEISGNEKTDDSVIRRLLDQSEGARYAGTQVKHSKEALKRAQFVEDVRVSFPKGSVGDKVHMKVDVTEKKSGSIAGGFGFSQREKVIITARITEKNLLGKGYQASINGKLGKVTQDITASLADPYFLDTNISASLNAFKTKTDPQLGANYQTNSVGGGIAFSVPMTHYMSYGINYQFNSTELSNVPVTASLFQRAQIGRQTVGELTQSLTWDSRDRYMATSSGHIDSVSFSVAGLGGNERFLETAVSSRWYFPFGEKENIILNPSVGYRSIRGFSGQNIPLWRRYSLGGIGSMRGFDSLGITVIDPNTNEAVGGDNQITASANLFFPLPYVQTAGIRGLFFVDAGTLWGSASATVGAVTINVQEPFSLSRVRYAAGFGIEWISPIGPVGLTWAFPIRTVSGDREKSFEFAIGTTF
ncbi:MAG: outer membrane protein assembly factor BamA [Mariprofundus sp.]|nr:outer membrane protein assembly factor BamA [Mariprofundus sp.]